MLVYPFRVNRALPSLLLFLLVWPAPAALAQPEPADPTEADLHAPAAPGAPASPRERLLTAIACYQRSEFDMAKKTLLELAAARDRTGMEALLYLGFVHVAYGEREAAQAAFQRALAMDPELSLPVRSPAIDAVFDQAKRRFEARRRALDHDPPRLSHEPPGKAPYGKPVTIKVEAADPSGIKRVILNHRLAGNRGFSSVNMERTATATAAGEGGGYLATIPGLAVSRPGVEYYVAAWDSLNNGPGLKGSAGAPIKVKVEGGPLRQAPEPQKWYQKWWVWASVAGVVAIAGGVALGVYLDRDEVGRIDARLPAGLDP